MAMDNIPFSSTGFEWMVLSVQRRAEMLEKTQLGKGLEWSEVQSLSGFMEAYKVGAGNVVCQQGEACAFLSIVCRGRVDIIKEGLGNKNKIIASLGPGNSLGEMSLIDGEPRSATAVAHTPIELLILTKEGYERLSNEYPRLWGKLVVKIAKTLSRRLRQTSGILAEYLEN
ncbi:MAG: cyclic nucleotide-binding domain-containing protein [Desulfuromonadales bacterium]